MNIKVNPELKSLIPPLSEDERSQLEKNLLEHGCRDPLVVWDGVLLDGHNRLEICQRHGLDYETVELEFESVEQARVWMRDNQMGRRNLSAAWRIDLQLANKEDLAKIGAAKRAHGQTAPGKTLLSQNDKSDNPPEPKHNTQAEIAKAANTSTGMVGMAEVVRTQAPELWEKAKRDEVTVSAAYKNVKKKQRREEIQQRKVEAEKVASDKPKRFRLMLGSLTSLLDQQGGFADFVITDPPYPKQYLPIYDDLARVAQHILKDGGSLLCMTGQTYLPQVMQSLCSELQYHWTIAYLTPGGQAVQQFPRKVNAFWKPVIWMTKGEYAGEWVGDATRSIVNDNDKRHHHWGQSESGMHDLMKRFVMPWHVVVDPFMGAGTTGVVALDLGAEFIGVDVDDKAYATTEDRLNAIV